MGETTAPRVESLDRSKLRFINVEGLQPHERTCAKTPQAALHLLNGVGHYCFRDQPEAFNRVLRGFCRREDT